MTKETTQQKPSLYSLLSADLPEEAVERAKKEITRKGYDTTGYQYQYIVNRLNDVMGVFGWSYEYSIVKEFKGAFPNGTQFYDVTVEVKIILTENETTISRVCIGGHRSVTYADALKGSITNGFKKTAAFFGVGKKAYEGTIDDDYRAPSSNDIQYSSINNVEQGREASTSQICPICQIAHNGRYPKCLECWKKTKQSTDNQKAPDTRNTDPFNWNGGGISDNTKKTTTTDTPIEEIPF